jgi:hypothetical protein
METVRINSTYSVSDEGNVLLTVVFGDAQFGSSHVERLNGELLRIGDVDRLSIGKGSAIRGTGIRVVSTVTDINPNTNLLSVTYSLSGGAAPSNLTETDDVPANTSEKFEHVIAFV